VKANIVSVSLDRGVVSFALECDEEAWQHFNARDNARLFAGSVVKVALDELMLRMERQVVDGMPGP
jgi:hypothetical protein